MTPEINKITADGFTADYLRFGAGERTMVILPGLSVQSVMLSAGAVEESYKMFARDFTVYLFDRRPDPPEGYTVRDMARDTAAEIDALGLKDICLFGASQGGMIAMTLAAARPGLISKLILGSTAAKVPDKGEKLERWIDLAESGDCEGLYLDFGKAVYPPSVFEPAHPALSAAAKTVTADELSRFVILARGTPGFDVTPELYKIACPVLLLSAADDAVLGPDAGDEIEKALGGRPDFERHIYDGFGHAAYDTAPDYRERMYRFFMKP